MERLRPHLNSAYAQLTDGSKEAGAIYRSTLQDVTRTTAPAGLPAADAGQAEPAEDLRLLSIDELTDRYVKAFAASRRKELERGISLVGPHRDELELILGAGTGQGLCLPR